MKYYIYTIEQIKGEAEGEYSEYGKSEKVETESGALNKYYQKLANVSASETHEFMDIKIVNSIGGIIKKEQIGSYIDG